VSKYSDRFIDFDDDLVGVIVTHMDQVTWKKEECMKKLEDHLGVDYDLVFVSKETDGQDLLKEISEICKNNYEFRVGSEQFLKLFPINNKNLKILKSIKKEVSDFQHIIDAFNKNMLHLTLDFQAFMRDKMIDRARARVEEENDFKYQGDNALHQLGHIRNMTNLLEGPLKKLKNEALGSVSSHLDESYVPGNFFFDWNGRNLDFEKKGGKQIIDDQPSTQRHTASEETRNEVGKDSVLSGPKGFDAATYAPDGSDKTDVKQKVKELEMKNLNNARASETNERQTQKDKTDASKAHKERASAVMTSQGQKISITAQNESSQAELGGSWKEPAKKVDVEGVTEGFKSLSLTKKPTEKESKDTEIQGRKGDGKEPLATPDGSVVELMRPDIEPTPVTKVAQQASRNLDTSFDSVSSPSDKSGVGSKELLGRKEDGKEDLAAKDGSVVELMRPDIVSTPVTQVAQQASRNLATSFGTVSSPSAMSGEWSTNLQVPTPSVSTGKPVLVVWSDEHKSYKIFQDGTFTYPHFLHHKCADKLGLTGHGDQVAAKVVETKLEFAAKADNRWKVEVGTWLYVVKCQPMEKESSARVGPRDGSSVQSLRTHLS